MDNSTTLKAYGPGLLMVLVLIFGLVYGIQLLVPNNDGTKTIHVGDTPVEVRVADTEALREKGLSDTERLLPLEGMLFVFPDDGNYSFWMKNMNFPIDVLWLSKDGVIVHALQALSPETYPHTFSSPVPARYVLEVPSGFMEIHHVFVGNKVSL